ncbi:MAG: hypothetical protein KKF33_10695 [Alphaproteobacteria bacterium]|jgi:hypothetical protein|nr:hypothetical protein [Alphaproteobacteria bacterium]
MTKQQEKVLVAALCGLVISAVAAYAVQPAIASMQTVQRTSPFASVHQASVLDLQIFSTAQTSNFAHTASATRR